LAPEVSKYEQLQVAQLADLNPGIRAGLFWTVPVTDDAVSVNTATASATLHLIDVGVYDFTDLAAALNSPAVGQPSVATLTVKWVAARDASGVLIPAPADDSASLTHADHFAANATIVFQGRHVPDTARAGEAAAMPLAFRSGTLATPLDPQAGPNDTRGQVTPNPSEDPAGANPAAFGVVGTERNGSYYPG
jgi:hypothetical protein